MKVCFIGLGSIGTRHCLNLRAICEEDRIPLEIHALRSSRRAVKDALKDIPIRYLYSEEETDAAYDAVFITNPTALHYETLKRFRDKSQCFFIEKPVFETGEENIAGLQLQTDTMIYVAAPLRYTQVIREARAFAQSHRIYSARAISSSYLPEWRPGQDYRQTYSAQRALGGGVAIDLIHEWDYLSLLFGIPKKVYSLMGRYSGLEIDSDDLAVYIAEYDGMLCEVHLDYFGRPTQRKLELYTADGCWTFDIAHGRVTAPDGTRETYDEAPNEKYLQEMRYFVQLVRNGETTSENSLEHACEVLRITKGEAR